MLAFEKVFVRWKSWNVNGLINVIGCFKCSGYAHISKNYRKAKMVYSPHTPKDCSQKTAFPLVSSVS